MKNQEEHSIPVLLARLEGLEPPTIGLEGRRSIQLSYRRVSRLSSTIRILRPDRYAAGFPKIKSAARSATATVGACVLPDGKSGKIDASTMRNP